MIPPVAEKLRARSLVTGAVGTILCLLFAWSNTGRFLQAYLFAWWFFLGISLGALAVLMMYRLTGGPWGPLVEPALAAAAQGVSLMGLLFLPIALLHGDIYPWVHPSANDAAVAHAKSWYLNTPFFLIRAAIYFTAWTGLAWLMRKAPLVPHASPDGRNLRRISIAGLIVYALSVSFASVDWVMSLTPAWYSSAFGLLIMVREMLSGFAFAVLAATFSFSDSKESDKQHFHDLGNLLLVFVMTWAYLAYTQYLIIWAENLPDEISWYVPRTLTDWKWIAFALITFHFALPLLALLFRAIKRSAQALAWLAGSLLVAHWADAYWLVLPSVQTRGFSPHLADLAASLGIGGFWFAWVLRCGVNDNPTTWSIRRPSVGEVEHA